MVDPATINGVTWPMPKKNKKIIEIVGLLACDTHARRVAKTGVIQGDEASPKEVPIAKGTKKDGILSSIIFSQFLDLQYSPNLLILGLSLTIGVIFIFISGVLSIRKTIYASPVITLRDS